ncbi:hypothetical protein [Flavobacterium eburneipallidum]|uniref:hypothetical protein n=1 Tax=Flavobacterium eburneipallidum TaxID=3003263 RepID=UPI0022AC880F|nr:hypothetical protein [Flavobacterium eburneipallidum]
MEKLNYNEILNLTLSVLLKQTSDSHIEYNDLFSRNAVLINLSNRDKLAVIQKLVKDGYASRFETIDKDIFRYYITVEGILFINSDGYISKENKERQLKLWLYTKNVLLVLGTVSAFILAVFEINEKIHPKETLIECRMLLYQQQFPNNTILKEYKSPIQGHCSKVCRPK